MAASQVVIERQGVFGMATRTAQVTRTAHVHGAPNPLVTILAAACELKIHRCLVRAIHRGKAVSRTTYWLASSPMTTQMLAKKAMPVADCVLRNRAQSQTM